MSAAMRSWVGLAVLVLLGAAVGGGVWAVTRPRAAEPAKTMPTPAVVAQPLKEEQINTITLTPAAVVRLGLQIGAVERKPIRRTRPYGAEVVVPVGQAVAVAAPLCGIVKAPEGGLPSAGGSVIKGQTVIQLLPLLSPEARANLAAALVEAEGQVRSAQAQREAAKIALDRAQRVYASEAGSRRAVDEAQAQFNLAAKAVEAASGRRDTLQKAAGELGNGTAAPLAIASPSNGIVRNVTALPEQTVPAGAALFEVVDLGRIWVRVPVYVGDLPDVDQGAAALVGPLAPRTGDAGRPAAPVTAPPSANPAAGTIDLYYVLDNPNGSYRPGERVGARIPLVGEADSLTVPWASVVHDIYGGAWVYEVVGERVYARRRVAVRSIAGDSAVLAGGPAAGTPVVTSGAAELFGAETGFSK